MSYLKEFVLVFMPKLPGNYNNKEFGVSGGIFCLDSDLPDLITHDNNTYFLPDFELITKDGNSKKEYVAELKKYEVDLVTTPLVKIYRVQVLEDKDSKSSLKILKSIILFNFLLKVKHIQGSSEVRFVFAAPPPGETSNIPGFQYVHSYENNTPGPIKLINANNGTKEEADLDTWNRKEIKGLD